jgi:hypothetical protein
MLCSATRRKRLARGPDAPAITAACLFMMMETANRQGAAMSAHKPDYIINHQETAARLADIIDDVVRDLDALVREFAVLRPPFSQASSEPGTKAKVN